jgi:hypothetical protein
MRRSGGALRSDQLVNALAQVFQHEILIGGGFAVVDFLRPLFERQLDAEGLVDGEGNVEKVQTVDLKIVDRVTFRLDVFARNVASFRNDGRTKKWRRPSPARASPVASGPSCVKAPYSEGCCQVQRRPPLLTPRPV